LGSSPLVSPNLEGSEDHVHPVIPEGRNRNQVGEGRRSVRGRVDPSEDGSPKGGSGESVNLEDDTREDDEDEDLSDDVVLRRHEEYALQERGRWATLAQPPQPSSNSERNSRAPSTPSSIGESQHLSPPVTQARHGDSPQPAPSNPDPGKEKPSSTNTSSNNNRKRVRGTAPMLPLFPTPLGCHEGMEKLLVWWEQETHTARQAAALLMQQRRENYASGLGQVLVEFNEVVEEVERLKLKAERTIRSCMERSDEAGGEFLRSPTATRGPLECFERAELEIRKRRKTAEKLLKQALGIVEPRANGSSPASPLANSEEDALRTSSEVPIDGTGKRPNETLERFLPPEGYLLDGKPDSVSIHIPHGTSTVTSGPGALILPPSTVPVRSSSVERKPSTVRSPSASTRRPR